MARRVFEIAKELGVKSKAIVEKCQHEGIPAITNHMSSVSIGLEATIREWFAGGGEGGTATAIETAEKVDLEKVKARPRKRTAKKRAAAKPGANTEVETEAPASAATTTVAPDTDPPDLPPADGPPTPAPLDSGTAIAEPPADSEAPETAASPSEAPAELAPRRVAADHPIPEAKPAPTQASAPTAQTADTDDAPATDTEPPATSTDDTQATPPQTGPADKPAAKPNVPTRPTVIKPAGPQLETKKPASLSGPKVVRVEAPEQVAAPRSRGPRESSDSGVPMSRGPRGGGGVSGPMIPPTADDPAGRGRNKRRRSGEGAPAGGGGGGRRRGGGGGDDARWRSQDLIEREERLNRSEGFLRQRRRDQKIKSNQPTTRAKTAAETGGKVSIASPFTIKQLSAVTGVRSADIVKKLFMQGEMATSNSVIEDEKAQEIMLDYEIDLQVTTEASGHEAVLEQHEARETVDERDRSPVVTILGHVDHGKTSLLDRIRNANVAAGEAGGITQATSAFRVNVDVAGDEKTVCFLDTPGHEAFTEMRARGANMTDIVVLVVAADDGVMPQTVESIAHAKAAGVPIIIALNKIDLPGASDDANLQRIYGQLAENELNPSPWGGDTEVIQTSAQSGLGVDTLLETLAITSDLLELTADFGGPAFGVVVEAKMEEGRGAVANILVQQGELKVGDFLSLGRSFGRVRDMTNDRGERIKTAGPATPVQISGIDMLPDAGDKFYCVKTIKLAQEAAEQRRDEERQRQLAQPKLTLDSMFSKMDEAERKDLPVVLKADVQGSIDAIAKSIEDISTDDINVRLLHRAVGGVTESDVTLAAASGAIILGFNVIPSGAARKAAEQKGVEIRAYRVIYDIVDDVKRAAEGLLEPELREEILGHAEVREVFKISKVGAVAGCYVTNGTIERNALIRVTRDDIVIEQDRVLEQLKRFKEDAKEVKSGLECGMKIHGYDDIKQGDILECFKKIEVKRTL